jgi:predicted dehydrogenase
MAPAVHAAEGAELYAVAARDLSRAEALRPLGSAYSAYDELLTDPNVDAVYVALANDAHCRWAVAALDAGKHVLCEKPLGLNVGEVDAMAVAAGRAARLLVEALFYRWHPQTQRAEQLVREGHVGVVRAVEAGFSFRGVEPGSFRLDPESGGGALYDVGCYPISAALWAFGRSTDSVTATLRPGPTGVDAGADLVLTFDSGRATVHVGIDEPESQWLRIVGEHDVLEVPRQPYTSWFGPDGEIHVGGAVLTVPATDPYRVMVEQVSAAVRGEQAYVVPLSESRAVAAVVDAAFESAREGGRTVAL